LNKVINSLSLRITLLLFNAIFLKFGLCSSKDFAKAVNKFKMNKNY